MTETETTAAFRRFLFLADHPRIAGVQGLDAYAYREAARAPGTFTGELVRGWSPLYLNDFRGVTEDGALREGLYPLEPSGPRGGGPGGGDGRSSRGVAVSGVRGGPREAHPPG